MYIKVCIYNDYSENLMILFHVYVFLVLVSTAESYIGAFESFDLFFDIKSPSYFCLWSATISL